MKVFQTICARLTGGTPLVFYRETLFARVVFPLRRVFPVARVSSPLPLKTKRQWILFCRLSKGRPVWIGTYQGLAHLRKWSTIEHHRQGCPCPAQEATVSSMLSCTQDTQLQERSFGPSCKGIQSFLIKWFKCCILSRFTRIKLGMVIERSKFPENANVRFGCVPCCTCLIAFTFKNQAPMNIVLSFVKRWTRLNWNISRSCTLT